MKHPPPSEVEPVAKALDLTIAEQKQLQEEAEPASKLLYTKEDKVDLSVWTDEGGA